MAFQRVTGQLRWWACGLLATAIVIAGLAPGQPSVGGDTVARAALLTANALPFDAVAEPNGSETPESLTDAGAADTVGAPAGALADSVVAVYNAIEPWTRWGAESLAWLVHWVPLAGLLAPQITIFYDLGEQFIRGVVFNTADLLDGDIDLGQAMANISAAGSQALDAFLSAQSNWINGLLPPFPPLPPPPVSAQIGDAEADQENVADGIGADDPVVVDQGSLLPGPDPDVTLGLGPVADLVSPLSLSVTPRRRENGVGSPADADASLGFRAR